MGGGGSSASRASEASRVRGGRGGHAEESYRITTNHTEGKAATSPLELARDGVSDESKRSSPHLSRPSRQSDNYSGYVQHAESVRQAPQANLELVAHPRLRLGQPRTLQGPPRELKTAQAAPVLRGPRGTSSRAVPRHSIQVGREPLRRPLPPARSRKVRSGVISPSPTRGSLWVARGARDPVATRGARTHMRPRPPPGNVLNVR